jgi:hypothetical protein
VLSPSPHRERKACRSTRAARIPLSPRMRAMPGHDGDQQPHVTRRVHGEFRCIRRDYFTGPASRNPDNQMHARVQQDWMPNTRLVSFSKIVLRPGRNWAPSLLRRAVWPRSQSCENANGLTGEIVTPVTLRLLRSAICGFPGTLLPDFPPRCYISNDLQRLKLSHLGLMKALVPACFRNLENSYCLLL